MMNLFKMDLHRFLTNKIMYILLLVFIAFQIFGIFMIKQYEQPVEQGRMLISQMNESQFIQQIMAQTPSWVLMYVTVFSVYFYMSEYNAGFYKNYISMKRARMYSVLSKIVILGLFTLLMMLVMVVADLIGRAIFFQQATLGDLGYLSTLLAGQFLLHWAFSIVILSLTMILKSMLTSIVTGIILALNSVGMAVGALESLFTDLNMSAYLLVNTIVRMKDLNQLSDVIQVFSVAIAFILLFSCIAIRYKMKEDLK